MLADTYQENLKNMWNKLMTELLKQFHHFLMPFQVLNNVKQVTEE